MLKMVSRAFYMSMSCNKDVISEGVETEAQAEFLRSHGVEYAQGWLFDKAMPLPDLIQRLELQVGSVT